MFIGEAEVMAGGRRKEAAPEVKEDMDGGYERSLDGAYDAGVCRMGDPRNAAWAVLEEYVQG